MNSESTTKQSHQMAAADPSFDALCRRVQTLVPQAVGGETWYLIIAVVLVASPDPTRIGALYTHLTAPKPLPYYKYTNVSLRLRDALMKEWTIIGIPPVVTAVAALAKAEGNVGTASEQSVLSDKWSNPLSPTEVASRGHATLLSIYGESLLPKIMSTWGGHHADFKYMETSILYGQFLSEHSILNAVESETVVLASILCTGFRGPGMWHLRGLGRLLGARGRDDNVAVLNDLEKTREAIVECVRWSGGEMVRRTKVEEWPTVVDVMSELGGFGE